MLHHFLLAHLAKPFAGANTGLVDVGIVLGTPPINQQRPFAYELDDYESVKLLQGLVIYNRQGNIDASMALKILYAMTQQKPMVLLQPPIFGPGIGAFTKKLINDKLSKFLLCDVTKLDQHDFEHFLSRSLFTTINYTLNKHQVRVIRLLLRRHFNSLTA